MVQKEMWHCGIFYPTLVQIALCYCLSQPPHSQTQGQNSIFLICHVLFVEKKTLNYFIQNKQLIFSYSDNCHYVIMFNTKIVKQNEFKMNQNVRLASVC